ncbi:MAG TPA: adenosylcobinamide-GDP ribazoletransferase [candidate division Zixibacteria bacterium]|nr:adenosylcobinamide-GDP ribazoletransferase [candidate division Zixibacteria bacterium]
MSSFVVALRFLTLCPWPRSGNDPVEKPGRSAIFFPVIGFGLGCILVAAETGLSLLASPGLTGVVLVALLAVLTRSLHLDGLGDTFDALGASRERALEAMADSRIGAFGAVAIALTILFKVEAIAGLGVDRWRALLAAPVLGRWAMVLCGYRSVAARPGLGSLFANGLEAKHLLVATAIALVLVSAVLRGPGLVVMAWVAAVGLGAKAYAHRRLGGVTGDVLGAIGELGETSVLALLALGAR